MRPTSFAIIGAGPAGSYAAECLASAGFAVTLFDPKGAWEKPCGGGVTPRALERYRFLLDDAWPSQTVDFVTMVGPSRSSVELDIEKPFRIFARERLNGLLLERALSAGASLVSELVTRFARDDEHGGWIVATKTGEYRADILVGADGAGSIVRRDLAGRFRPTDVALTIGYNAPFRDGERLEREVVIDFPAEFSGYMWRFPRTDHVNFGTFNRLNERPAAELKQRLHEFMANYYGNSVPLDSSAFYGAKCPMLASGSWDSLVTSGPDWVLVGDAAGFVDPITGEGIYYAIRSGELLSRAFEEGGSTADYDRLWRDDFGEDLAQASRFVERFYHGRFLGAPFLDRAVSFAKRHRGIRKVMRKALGGEQSYLTLKRDLVLSAVGFR